ncbi:MAG: Rubrerythrin, partial [Candidatus Uhrbacteria bacterium GW2011_GWD2_52_7]
FLSILSIVGGFVYKISYYEFLFIIFLITVGLVIETINTGLEETTDAIDTKIREDIKIAKLFDAASKAEAIHAANHKKVLEGLGVTMDDFTPEFEVKTTENAIKLFNLK